MNILRPRPLSLHKIISWNANTSNFATKYWKRTNCSYSWNMLRPCHVLCTARSTDNEYTCYAHPPNNATILSSPNIPCKVSSLQLAPTSSSSSFLDTLHMKTSIRGMSSIKSKSKNGNFSTIGVPDSTSANNDDKQDDKQDLDSLPASQKAKILFKKYGAVFVGTYFGIYFTTLFSFFVALDFGLLDPDVLSQIFKTSKNMACETADVIGPTGVGASMNEAANAYAEEMTQEISEDKRSLVDIVSSYLYSWDWSKKYAEKLSENPHLANLAVAWFMVKFTEPIRLGASIIATPKVAKLIGKKVR